MEIKHYKDNFGNIYGYIPSDIEVTEISISEFKVLKVQQESQFIEARNIQSLEDQLHAIETQIKRYERIKDRTETEEQELDALIEQSTVLFREIKAAETKGEAK